MAPKKRKDQLENLLEWEREGGRLPETKDLFNRQISPTFFLRERTDKVWQLSSTVDIDGVTHVNQIILEHTTLIQLGLTILDAVGATHKRFADSHEI